MTFLNPIYSYIFIKCRYEARSLPSSGPKKVRSLSLSQNGVAVFTQSFFKCTPPRHICYDYVTMALLYLHNLFFKYTPPKHVGYFYLRMA